MISSVPSPSPDTAPGPTAAHRPAPRPLFFGLGLVLLTLIVYLPVLQSQFVNFDDGLYVSSNSMVKKGLTWEGFLWAWQANVASNWHPLTMLSHMLDVQLYGLNPKGHHLTNLLFHLASVWGLFEVLRRMTDAVWRSATVAALFALHPLHVESVAWIAERKDVLSGLFFVLTLGLYHAFVRERAPRTYVFLCLSFALGLLAKSMLVTLPCVLLLIDAWPLGRLPVESWAEAKPALRPLLREKVPLFLLAAVMSGITLYTQKRSLAKLEAVSVSRRTGNALTSYAVYLGKTFWPVKLAAFYPLPRTIPLWQSAASVALLVAVTALVLWRLRRAPWLAVGWLWFVGMLVPVIGILQVGRQGMADRYTYLPSIGLSLALVWQICEWANHPRAGRLARRALPAVTVVMLAVLAAVCRAQVETWKDSKTLFTHALRVTDRNYLAHLNLGVAIAKEGDQQRAMAEYAKALAIQPNMVEAQAAMGTALHRQGKDREALPHLQAAARLRPDSAQIRQTLAVTLEDLGRHDEAVVQLHEALALNPDFADAHYGLGSILQKQGKTDEALKHYQKALELNPDLNELYNPTATLLAAKGDLTGAARLLTEAVHRQPDNPTTAYNLAVTLERLGKIDDARTYYARALELNPDLTAARQRLELTGGMVFP